MKKKHKKFIKVIKKTLKSRPDLSFHEIVLFLLKNINDPDNLFVLLTMKRRAKKLIRNAKKENNISTEAASTGGSSESPSQGEN